MCTVECRELSRAGRFRDGQEVLRHLQIVRGLRVWFNDVEC